MGGAASDGLCCSGATSGSAEVFGVVGELNGTAIASSKADRVAK